jgi:prophage maintenance system killer protein
MKKVLFLTLAEVIEIYNDQIQRYGGSVGVRDMNLLSSAIAMPYATFSGEFFHICVAPGKALSIFIPYTLSPRESARSACRG